MENIDIDIDTENEHPHPHLSVDVHPIVQIVANMMNYLSVSLYEGQFTLKHEQARTRLSELYDYISKTPSAAPSLRHSSEFYYNVKELRNVTDTDDPDYYAHMRKLKAYMNTLEYTL
jgi:glutamate formiminotransferase